MKSRRKKSVKPSSPQSITFAYAQNPSEKDEDRVYHKRIGNRLITAVFDGHGGSFIVDQLLRKVEQFHELLDHFDHGGHVDDDSYHRLLEARVKRVFSKLDNELRHADQKLGSGSTAVIAFHDLENNRLHFVHIGDSRAVFEHAESAGICATKDHKPSDTAEIARIQSAGGRVFQNNAYDLPRVEGIMATSRSFGDFILKDPIPLEWYRAAAAAGQIDENSLVSRAERNEIKGDLVSADPSITTCTLGPFGPGSVYALFSDGIVDAFEDDTNRVVMQEIRRGLREGRHLTEIARGIAEIAREMGSHDDISIAIVVGV